LRPLVVSLAIHAVLIGGISLLPARLLPAERFATVPDARIDFRPVARAAAEPDLVVLPPTRAIDDSGSPGEPCAAALVPELADEEPPPLAAPSIAVDGGAHAPVVLPSDWVPRVSTARSIHVGKGRGSRRGGTGAGGSGGGAGTGPAPEPPMASASVVVEPPPPPPPPVRVAARLVRYESPPYPRSAREKGLEGVVRVEVDVEADGTAGEVRVTLSSGVDAFDEAAVKSVRAWRFSPATEDGAAVRSTLRLPPIRFRLE
jgi:TonB family protein